MRRCPGNKFIYAWARAWGLTMTIIIFLIVIILYFSSFIFRLILHNPINILKYIPNDLRNYYRYKSIPKKPFINVYVGLFGEGKTLSAVHDVIEFYNTYNDKRVYDDRFNRWTTQKVMILSNVNLTGVKYRYLRNLDQINKIAEWRHVTDKKQNVRTITIVLIDEASTQLSHRDWAKFPPQFLQTLLTSRHALIHGFYLTSQRFSHIDALLRQVSTTVIQCHKVWRFQEQTYYDAWSYENSSKPTECPVQSKQGFFVTDQDYAAYNTLEVVSRLAKDAEDGKLLDSKEVLERTGSGSKVYVVQDKKKRKRK